jgi:hypothetical protein
VSGEKADRLVVDDDEDDDTGSDSERTGTTNGGEDVLRYALCGERGSCWSWRRGGGS